MKHLILFPLLFAATCARAQTLTEIRHFLIQYEGYRDTVYIDPSGYRTIGIGHNLDSHGKHVPVGTRYTAQQIEAYFRDDLQRVTTSLRRYVINYDTLPKDIKLVLISVTWTVGPNGIHDFRVMRNMINRGLYGNAAAALQDSLWWSQVGTRRAREHYIMLRAAK